MSAASPLCQSFHMVERSGLRRACDLCPPPCPDCRGQGFRITTDDGTRPACLTCDGLGWLVDGRGTHDQPLAEMAHV
jgi:hypothetical protein